MSGVASMALVLALLLSLLLADASLLRSTCVDVGIWYRPSEAPLSASHRLSALSSQACEASELEEEYCRATGKRLEMRCNGRSSSAEETDFRSCMATPSDEMVRVVVFQACMAIIGGSLLPTRLGASEELC